MHPDDRLTEVVALLHSWFSHNYFQIQSLQGEGLNTVLATLRINQPTDIGNRSELGKILHSIDGRFFDLHRGQRVQFSVIQWANDNIPGRFQIHPA